MAALSQRVDPRAEVDMERLPVQYQRRHEFYSCLLRLSQAIFRFTEVHDFHIVTLLIQRGGDLLFRSHTDRTTCVIEYSFLLAHDVLLWFVDPGLMPASRRQRTGRVERRNRVLNGDRLLMLQNRL